MTAITASFQRHNQVHDLQLSAYPVTAATNIPTGAIVCLNAAGTAVNGAEAAGLSFAGVAYRGYDNSAGLVGVISASDPLANARVVEVDRAGVYSFAIDGAAPVAGQIAYLVDNNTVSATAGANSIIVGTFTQPDPTQGTDHWMVKLNPVL